MIDNDEVRHGDYDINDRRASLRDHDLLIRLETRMGELCKDIKEVAAEVRIINSRCNVQPKQCHESFVDRELYALQYTTLMTKMEETFNRFKEEQHEERIKNRWFIGILVSIVNIAASITIHIFSK